MFLQCKGPFTNCHVILLYSAIFLKITGLEFLSFFAFLKVTFGTTIEIENLDLGYNGSPSMDCSNGENIMRYECN